jgi:hypothetical protein
MALSKRVNKWPAVFDMAEPAFQRGFYATEITDPDNPHFLQTVLEQAVTAVRKSAKNPEATLATITATEWRKCLIASTSVQTRTKYDYTAEEVQTCINIMVSLALTRHGAFGLDTWDAHGNYFTDNFTPGIKAWRAVNYLWGAIYAQKQYNNISSTVPLQKNLRQQAKAASHEKKAKAVPPAPKHLYQRIIETPEPTILTKLTIKYDRKDVTKISNPVRIPFKNLVQAVLALDPSARVVANQIPKAAEQWKNSQATPQSKNTPKNATVSVHTTQDFSLTKGSKPSR